MVKNGGDGRFYYWRAGCATTGLCCHALATCCNPSLLQYDSTFSDCGGQGIAGGGGRGRLTAVQLAFRFFPIHSLRLAPSFVCIQRTPAIHPASSPVTQPTNFGALLQWFEEDLDALRRQRADMDARLGTLEARIAALRVSVSQATEAPFAPTPAVRTAAPAEPSVQSASVVSPVVVHREATVVAESAALPQSAPTVERRSIISLSLQPRTYNSLMNGAVRSFTQLIAMTPAELLKLPRFGAHSLSDLQRALARVGVSLPGDRWSSAAPATHRAELDNSSANSALLLQRSDDNAVDQSRGNVPAGYDDITALPFKFGAVHVEDLQKALGVDEVTSRNLLDHDERWTAASGGWYARSNMKQSWISRRIVEVLNAVKSINIEPLYQSIKRIATPRFTKEGWRMPSRTLLVRMVEDLRGDGVHFDVVHEIARIDAPIESREMSGTSKAVLEVFGATQRALSGAALSVAIQKSGMSLASAQLALSSSPLVIKLERGIYGLVGRTATMRDIANARAKPETSSVG